MTTKGPVVDVVFHKGSFTLPPCYDPPPDRFTSTPGDNLCELAGRVSYNSIDKDRRGRPTKEFFENILTSKHYSVCAHVVEVFEVACPNNVVDVLTALHNRPGVWVTSVHAEEVRFAVSLRAAIEWSQHGPSGPEMRGEGSALAASKWIVHDVIHQLLPLYPLALSATACHRPDARRVCESRRDTATSAFPGEEWVSLHVAGVSRDLLQELVRHHYQTNFSVRSTRYVDESASRQVVHPAIADSDPSLGVEELAAKVYSDAKAAYGKVYSRLTDSGVDRKTARGAARSLLPGATETKLVFSLSRAQAMHIMRLRLNQGTGSVDPEMLGFAEVLRQVLTEKVGWNV